MNMRSSAGSCAHWLGEVYTHTQLGDPGGMGEGEAKHANCPTGEHRSRDQPKAQEHQYKLEYKLE